MMDGGQSGSVTPNLTPESLIHLGQEELQKGNLRKAKFAFQYALKKAKLNGVQSYQASALLNMAVVCITAENPEQALDCFNTLTGLELADVSMGDVHYNKGLAYEMLNYSKEAANEYDLAFAAYKSGNIPSSNLCNASIKIGLFHMKRGKCKKSIDLFNVATRILSEKELIAKLAVVLCLKSKCLLVSNTSISEAIEVCNECYDLCKSISDDPVVVEIYNELGLLLTQCKQFERAGQCFLSAHEIHEDSSFETVSEKKAALLQNYGAILSTRGYFKSAAQSSLQAAEIYGSKGLRSSQCHCFLNIAFSYSQMKVDGALEKSKEYYLHALQAAKDTDSAKDLWQALEGLGGVALIKMQASSAVELYQRAIGLCASAGSTNQQDRLVRKLTMAVKMAANKTGSTSPQYTFSRQSTGLSGIGQLSETVKSHPPLMEMSYYRPPNLNAKREDIVDRREDVAELVSDSVHEQPIRKKKRKRNLSRRSDRKHDAIYFHPPAAVHHGLGTYRSQDDMTYDNHLTPEMARRGRRRQHHSGDDASIISVGLRIQGLAMDDPREPLVGSSRVRQEDVTQGDVRIRQVRPMSRKITHRPNSIMDEELATENEFASASDEKEFSDGYDMCPDSDEDGSDMCPDADEEVDGEETEEASDDDAKVDVQANRGVSEEIELNTNDLYSSIPQSAGKGVRPMSTFNKGKRPMSAKPILRKSSNVVVQRTGQLHNDQENKRTLLDTNDNFNEDSDAERVQEEMRKLGDRNEFESTTEDSEDEPNPQKKPGVHFSDDEESDTDSRDLASSDAHETYEKPITPTAGGNFFKGHPSTHSKTYETVNANESTAPMSNAPPPLPPRNYGNRDGEEEFAESTSSSENLEEMTRGERDRYLYEKHKHKSEKIVRWEGRKAEQKTKGNTKSRMCIVM